jgi:hypothetical protein
MRTTLLTAALSVILALPAAAQSPVKISFEGDGRVSVEASNATVRSILNEWSKNGGTKVLGAERVSGAPVTLKLVSVPESQALEAILRSVAGYMAAPARVATGPSMYDRIMIMATTSAPPPVNRAQPANNNGAMAGTQRFIPPRQRDEQPEVEEQEEPDENPPNPPVFTFPQPGPQNGVFQGFNQPGMIQQNQQQFPNANQPNVVINPATPAYPTTSPASSQPRVPVGVAQPGMMVPAPPQQPPQTRAPTRPPGQD